MANSVTTAISIAKKMITDGVVYVYGYKYEPVTISKVNSLAAMYPSVFSPSIKKMALAKVGKIGIDCSGFVCKAFGISNIGSSQLKAKMVHTYKVSDSSKIMNGMIIWRNGHIGLIEVDEAGEAWVLEAKGTAYDLVRSKYTTRGKSFTYYGELSGIDYSNARKIGNASSSTLQQPTKVICEVIDISHHNTINLSQTATKYKDVIIRVGYRASATGILTLDKKFLVHAQDAINNGFRMGFYIWDQSMNEAEAREQADWMVGLIKPLPVSYPLYIDSEYANQKHDGRADGISKEQRTKNIIAFCERIKELGYTPGVYASDSWFKSMVDFNQLENYEIWCARYSTNAPTISKYEMWQYGSTNVPGSKNPIDINRLYKDYSTNNATPSTPAAKFYNTVTASSLNVRNKPSTLGKVVDIIHVGNKLNIYALQNNWCKISETENKWCSYKYIRPTCGIVTNCSKLNCRQSPVTGKVAFILSSGSQIHVIDQDSSGWYFIEHDGKVGYVSNKYISLL